MFDDFDAVIFDMDGTLIDSMWVWTRVDEDFLSSRDIEVPKELQQQIEGRTFQETAQYFKNRFNLEEDIDEIINEWLSIVRHYYESVISLKDGAYDFIAGIKRRGMKVALATSNSRELTEIILKRTGIDTFFDSVVTSSEVNKDKSFPDIFLEAASQIGVHPSRCLVFEDTLTGIRGAKKAGMAAFAVFDEFSCSYREEISCAADKFINSFTEIA